MMIAIALILTGVMLGSKTAIAEAPEELPCEDYFDIRSYAKCRVNEHWDNQWAFFDKIIHKESGWNYRAKNPRSSATGLPQAMLSLHDVPEDYLTNPQTQVDWAISYITDTYGSPKAAWSFHLKNNWY